MKTENIEKQNLLINGDFQVNQRGQSEYKSNGLNLDMWLGIFSNDNSLKVADYGILISKIHANQTVLRQRNPNISKNDIGKKFTLRCMFDSDTSFINTIGFGSQRKNITVDIGKYEYINTFILQQEDFDSNENVDIIVFNNTNDNCQLKVYYCDLYEDEIIYMHQKESYNTALSRCLDYVEKKTINTVGIYNNYSGTEIMFFADYYKKRNIPTIQAINNGYSTGTASVQNKDIISLDTYADASKDSCGLLATIESPSNENLEGRTCKILGTEILISCEKL